MNPQEFTDRLVNELRRRRWVITEPRVMADGPSVVIGFNFTCPCGRVIVERVGFTGYGQPMQFGDMALKEWVRRVELELEKHVTEEFGKAP